MMTPERWVCIGKDKTLTTRFSVMGDSEEEARTYAKGAALYHIARLDVSETGPLSEWLFICEPVLKRTL